MTEHWNVLKSWTIDSQAKGITVDPNHNVYFTNFYGVWKLKDDANSSTPECIFESTDDPEGILFHDNTLFICDSSDDSNRIIRYSTESDTTCVLLDDCGCYEASINDYSMEGLHCITIDSHGDAFFTEDNMVRKINRIKKMTEIVAGSGSDLSDGGASKIKFSKPRGLAVGTDGTIYVCEFYGCRIRQIKDGYVTTIAGKLRNETSMDGKLKDASFNRPLHIAIDVDGTLLVAEKNAIRRIDLNAGTVSTLLGLESVKEIQSMALDKHHGIIYIGTNGNQILKIVRDTFCRYEKFVWIGYLKECPNCCHLARLPKEIIKEITQLIRCT